MPERRREQTRSLEDRLAERVAALKEQASGAVSVTDALNGPSYRPSEAAGWRLISLLIPAIEVLAASRGATQFAFGERERPAINRTCRRSSESNLLRICGCFNHRMASLLLHTSFDPHLVPASIFRSLPAARQCLSAAWPFQHQQPLAPHKSAHSGGFLRCR